MLAYALLQGFTWGSSPSELLSTLTPPSSGAFDLILLSDLVFNHNQHDALLDSCLACLNPNPSALPLVPVPAEERPDNPLPAVDLSSPRTRTGPLVLCFWSHHRPTEALLKADLGILDTAREKGWKVDKVWEDKEAGVSSGGVLPSRTRRAADAAMRCV